MSWVFSLINPAPTQQLAPSDNNNKDAIFSDRKTYDDGTPAFSNQGLDHKQAEPMDEEEEAARSPYWHVCISSQRR